jgi:hypothetical protein
MQPQDFANTIKAAWRGSTKKVLEACVTAAAARASGQLAETAALLAGTVDSSTLRRLAIIGECAALYDPAVLPMLPPAWGTLYELTKVKNIADRFASGEVTPAIQRSTVTGWHRVANGANGAAPTPASTSAPATFEGSIKTLAKLRREGGKPDDLVGKVKPGELRLVIAFLQAVEAAAKAAGGTP